MIGLAKVALGPQGLVDFKVPAELQAVVIGDRFDCVAFQLLNECTSGCFAALALELYQFINPAIKYVTYVYESFMFQIMAKRDGRKLTPQQQQLIRIQAVDMVFKDGLSQRACAKLLGISRQYVCKWCKAFELGGYDALELGRRGRREGTQRLLLSHQCATLVRMITDKTPDQLKMPFMLWERVAVRELIIEKFGLVLSLRTVGNYLKRWGMTPQKPVKQAREQNTEAVNRWLAEEFPKIKERAEKEGAEIFWSDETGVQNTDNVGKSYSPKGKTPVIKKTGKKIRVNMISAVTNLGNVRFMIYSDKMPQQRFITFLKRLVKSVNKKVFVILDNLSVHHGKMVKQWVKSHQEEIELFYIPSYSPELNPDEYLNRDLKKNVNRSNFPDTLTTLNVKFHIVES